MLGKQDTRTQLFGGIALAAFVAVLAVPSAFAGSTFITDTLGGNGTAKVAPAAQSASVKESLDAVDRYLGIHAAEVRAAQSTRSTQPYVNGGMSASVATSNDPVSRPATQPIVATSSGFNWDDAALGAGLTAAGLAAAGLILLFLLGNARRRSHERPALTV
jgi:hypothetical protein